MSSPRRSRREICPPSVGTATAKAIKDKFKEGIKPVPKPEDKFQRLWKHVLAVNDGLHFFANGTIKITSPKEASAAKNILEALPSIVAQWVQLGVDIMGIYETFVATDDGRHAFKREVKPIGENPQVL